MSALVLAVNGVPLGPEPQPVEATSLREWAVVEVSCAPVPEAAAATLHMGGQDLGPPTTSPFDATWRWRWQPGGVAGVVQGELRITTPAGELRRSFALQLLPRAIDRQRFGELLAETSALARSLALRLGGAALAEATLVPTDDPGRAELEQALALLGRHGVTLRTTLTQLARRPLTTLRPTRQRRPIDTADRLRDIDPRDLVTGPLDQLAATSGVPPLLRDLTGGALPPTVSGQSSEATSDVPEQRFAAWLADELARRALLIRALAESSLARAEQPAAAQVALAALRDVASRLARQIGGLRAQTPLAGLAGRATPPAGPRLRRDRRLRPLLTIWRELRQRPLLALHAPLLLLPLADLPTLYESWCALSAAAALAELGEVSHQRLLAAEPSGWTLRLERDTPLVAVVIGQRTVSLRYQPRYQPGAAGFGSLDRYLRIPDLALEVSEPGGRWLAVLDAKYRVAPDGYPPQDALDDAYAYHGSLGHGGGPAVRYAGLLYPGQGVAERFGDVGALPHLPGSGGALTALLRELLA